MAGAVRVVRAPHQAGPEREAQDESQQRKEGDQEDESGHEAGRILWSGQGGVKR